MPKSNQKKKQVITKENTKKPSIKRNSRGSKQYALASDIQKSQKDYESQVSKESEDAGRRSLWTSVGGMLGAGIGLMAAPAILGVGALAGLGAVGTGLVTGGAVGLSSLVGSGAGLATAKTAGGARRDKIKVGKFFDKKAQEATDTFKDYDAKLQKSAQNQAIASGVMAGLQAGGAFKKMGELTKKGLNIGGKENVFNPNLVTSSDIGGTGEGLAHITDKGAASASQLTEGSTVGVKYTGPDIYASPFEPSMAASTSSTANRDLYSTIGDYLGKSASQAAITYGANKFMGGSKKNNNQFQQEDIGLPDYA